MAKDSATGKKTTFGNKRSRTLNSTRKARRPNPQKVCTFIDGKPRRVWVSAKTLKSGKVTCV